MEIVSKTFHNFNVRLLVGKKEWFIARDIAEILGYENPSRDINNHCKKVVNLKEFLNTTETVGLDQTMIDSFRKIFGTRWATTQVIPESDVWRLIIKSRLPEAEKIENWIFEEVLPEIRKTGSYSLEKEEKSKYAEIISETKEVLQLIDLTKDLSPKELFYLEKIMSEKSPTKLLGNSFKNSYFLPTEIGKMVGQTGVEINLILEKKGFQFQNENEIWTPTGKGKELCLEIGNRFNQLKWRIETIL